MRTIKFRAWDKEQNRMVFGWNNKSVELLAFDGTPYKTEGDKIVSLEDTEDNYILMQFTGLLDKNGKELYEGDIIQGEHSIWGKFLSDVRWVSWGFCCHDARSDNYNFMPSEFEVIGNIYENKELLT